MAASQVGERQARIVAERRAVVVPGLLDRGWCERLHAAIGRGQASPSQFYRVLSPPGDLPPHRTLTGYCEVVL